MECLAEELGQDGAELGIRGDLTAHASEALRQLFPVPQGGLRHLGQRLELGLTVGTEGVCVDQELLDREHPVSISCSSVTFPQ